MMGQEEKLNAIWQCRNAGRILEAQEKYAAFSISVGILPSQSLNEQCQLLQNQGWKPEEIFDLVLLNASFLRNQMRLEDAKEEIAKAEDVVTRTGLARPYQLAFQKGLNAIAESDFALAFDCFSESKRKARDSLEELASLYNLILSVESLGVEATPYLFELERLLKQVPDETWREFYRGKLAALRAAAFYRQGDLTSLSEAALSSEAEDQLDYFLAWLSHLPYLQGLPRTQLDSRFVTRYSDKGSRWLAGYRLRTLRGLFVTKDCNAEIRLKEKAERFYLWTWQWLGEASSAVAEKLLHLKQDFEKNAGQPLSAESALLYENAIRWLALFSGISEEKANAALKNLNPLQGTKVPTLEYESLLLDYLFARRAGRALMAEDTYRVLTQHPLHGKGEFLLPQLLVSLQSERGEENPPSVFEKLASSLWELFPKTPKKIMNGIVVGVLESSVRLILQGELKAQWLGTPLAGLLAELKGEGSLTKEEALKICFGIRRYDPYIHDPKLANFLSQANQNLKGWIRFQTKGNRIYLSLLEPKALHFEGNSIHFTQLSLLKFGDNFLVASERSAHSHQGEALSSFVETWKTRSEYEEFLCVSKATATRQIQKWLTREWLVKKGRGKNTVYQMRNELAEYLRKSRKEPR